MEVTHCGEKTGPWPAVTPSLALASDAAASPGVNVETTAAA